MDDYVIKPFDENLLIQTIAKYTVQKKIGWLVYVELKTNTFLKKTIPKFPLLEIY
jgi:hypothetical protein